MNAEVESISNENLDFIDRVKIIVKGGDGGNGAISFRREKYVPRGGPDGGDGGDGGFVFLRASPELSTLSKFVRESKFYAENGKRGMGKKRKGRNGKDLIIDVPIGTVVKDALTGEMIADLDEPGKVVCVARGGRGGRGNARFATPTRRAPRIAERGAKGEKRVLELELKLLADAGLVGFPNVGKSSIISRLSNARPKIADYPFTTLVPNLGVVRVGPDKEFVLSDIPGLIEGASEGRGLGNVFLRHVERCSVIVHVLDVSGIEGRDPVADYFKIREELEKFSPDLSKKPEIIVGNKVDLIDEETREDLKRRFEAEGLEILFTSAVTGEGLEELKWSIWEHVKDSKRLFRGKVGGKIEKPPPVWERLPIRFDLEIRKLEDGEFEVVSEGLKAWLERYDINEKDSRLMVIEVLEKNGLEEKLKEAGVREGDTVYIGNFAFEYREG